MIISRSPVVSSVTPFSRNSFQSRFIPQFFFETNPEGLTPDGQANGSGGGQSNKPDANAIAQAAVSQVLASQRVNGDKDSALLVLAGNANTQRTRAEAAEKALPSKEDQELLAAFKELKLPLADVKRIIEEHGTWGKERTNSAKLDGLKKAAAARKTSLDAGLLASLSGALDVEYVTRGEGENAEGFVIVEEGGKQVEKPLAKWAAEKWPDSAEKLKTTPTPPAKQVRRHGQSAPVNGGDKPSKADEIRKEVQERRSGAPKNGGEGAGGGNVNTSQSRAGTLLRRNR